MEAGDPRDHEQDPGAGRDRTRGLGHRRPTLLSGEEEAGAETGTAAGAEAETAAWIGARRRVEAGAGAARGPTLEVAESPAQGRGKTPGRDLDPGDLGPGPRGEERLYEGWLSLFLQFLSGLYHLGIFYVTFSLFPSIFPVRQHNTLHSTPINLFF